MPSPEQKRLIKTQLELMSVPFYTVREDDSRGAKHRLSQWQYDHWKARDATKCARNTGKDSIVQRWQEDETYRASQYENSLVLKLNDGPQPGRVTSREDFPQAARALAAFQREKITSRNYFECANAHSMKTCDQILNGKGGI